MNVKKTKTLVFEHQKSATPAFLYGTDVIEQVDEFKYLGMMMHGTKGLTPALELLCTAARRAMIGLRRRCQQLHMHDPVLKCQLFDALVRPILCYCCADHHPSTNLGDQLHGSLQAGTAAARALPEEPSHRGGEVPRVPAGVIVAAEPGI